MNIFKAIKKLFTFPEIEEIEVPTLTPQPMHECGRCHNSFRTEKGLKIHRTSKHKSKKKGRK